MTYAREHREAADLLAGQVVAHPGRLGEVTLDPAALGGTAGAIVRVLREAHERDEDPAAALLAAGLLTSAADRMLWWLDAPRSRAELQHAVRDAHRRRVLDTVAEVLRTAARDTSVRLEDALRYMQPTDGIQRRDVAKVLGWAVRALDGDAGDARQRAAA